MKIKKSLKFAAVILSALTFFQTLQSHSDAESISLQRIMGRTRYATSAQISQKSYSSADTVIIANGEKYPDALSGGQLAIALKAPILLVSQNYMPQEIESEIARLNPKKVIILGQTGSVSANIEAKLKAKYRTERLGGHSRYDTSEIIMRKTKSITNADELVLVSGKSYPDALSAAGYLKKNGALIMLSDGQSKVDFDGKITAIGGKSSISLPWFNGTRISGANRYDTALKIASQINRSNMVLASGRNFPDALSAVGLVDSKDASLILVDSRLNNAQEKYIKANAKNVFIVGGYASLSNYIEGQLGNRDVATVDKVYNSKKTFTKTFAPVEIENDTKTGLQYIKGRYLLSFKFNTSKESIKNILGEMNADIASYNPVLNMYAVDSELSENTVNNIVKKYKNNGSGLKSMTYDYLGDLNSDGVNDPWYDSLNNLQKENDVYYDWRKNIKEDRVWNAYDKIEQSGNKIKIGALDGEFDLGHEDLISNFAYDKETDNDNTGQVYAKMMNGVFIPEEDDYIEDAISGSSHGTHVSGIIGAISNNNKGINGVLRNVTILPYDIGVYTHTDKKFFRLIPYGLDKNTLVGGRVSTNKIYSGLENLIEDGAKVINLSAGCSYKEKSEANYATNTKASEAHKFMSRNLAMIMIDGLAKGKDFVIVMSAGNGAHGERYETYYDGYFAGITRPMVEECIEDAKSEVDKNMFFNESYENNLKNLKPEDILDRIIVVGASDKNNKQTYFSNDSGSERKVDIYAPGFNVYSTVFRTYNYMSGTSMAAPVVTGTAGFVYQLRPDFNGKDVKNTIIKSSSSGTNPTKVEPVNDDQGYGTPGYLVNLEAIVQECRKDLLSSDTDKSSNTDTSAPANTNLKLKFVDASTNNPISPAVTLFDSNGNSKSLNVENGTATVPANGGWKKIKAELSDYITLEENIDNSASSDAEKVIAMSKKLENNSIRIVLTWGLEPDDYDSHIYGTLVENNNMEHVFYDNKSDSYLNLDVDHTDSFGPETVTVKDFSKFNNLTYTVHNFSHNTSGINDTDLDYNVMPVVKVYNGNGLVKVYYPPKNTRFTYWKVFSISRDGNLIDKNEYGFESNPYSIANH